MDNVSSVPRKGRNFTIGDVGELQMTFPVDCAYGMPGVYALSLVDIMSDILFGNCTTPNTSYVIGERDDYNLVVCNPWYLKGLINNGNASLASINLNMGSIATAITSEMRKEGTTQKSQSQSHLGDMFATGTVIRTTACTTFDWRWLSFPRVLELITAEALCLLCGKTIFDTQGVHA
jgi:hypothetical protein